ncbi:MAG: putative Adenosylhomocysteine nucleosidase, partial [Nitrospira sp.]|nr:putative Adenosylhomocysteine nucleosidase [Nitrospira sp.]
QGRPTPLTDGQSLDGSVAGPVALFAATRWELAAVRRALPVNHRIDIGGVGCFIGRQAARSYWLIHTGIGPEAAHAAASAVLNRERMALAVSVGFAGALASGAEMADVIVGTSVVSGTFDGVWHESGRPVVCHERATDAARAAAADIGLEAHTGALLSVATVMCRAADKQRIARLTGAIAVDMESAALGTAALAKGVPFAVCRTVSDVVTEDLPLDFNLFLMRSGWMRGIAAIVMHPSSLIGLNRLRRQSRLAADRLTAVCSAYAARGFGLAPVINTGRA